MGEQSKNQTVLVVGNTEDFHALRYEFPNVIDTVFCRIDQLNQSFMEDHRPDVILSPLVTSKFDVVELAIKLDRLDFTGQFRAITAPLPNQEMVLNEVRLNCPTLDFDLIILQFDQILHNI